MRQILVLGLALAVCQGQYLPNKPHSKYGVPMINFKKFDDNIIPKLSNDYGIPKNILPVEDVAPVSAPHDSYGVPKKEYGVPQAPVTHIEPVSAPVPESEYGVPSIPVIHEEYGVPQASIMNQHEYAIPQTKPAAEYGVPQALFPHIEPVSVPVPEYGVPSIPGINEEYGVPQASIMTQYEYGIPQTKPAAEYGVPQAPVPHIEPVTAPVSKYGVPEIQKEYGVLPLPVIHEEYGVPQAPHNEPAAEYGVPKVQEEYGVPSVPVNHEEYGAPNKPQQVYGVPQETAVAPTIPDGTKFEYDLFHVKPTRVPDTNLFIYKPYGVPTKPHDAYGAPRFTEYVVGPAPKIRYYYYTIPHVSVPAPKYGLPVVYKTHRFPNVPVTAPHSVYGVPAL